MTDSDATLLTVPLDALHRELGGKMVPFAGYSMPVQYPAGVLAEHVHTRTHASLFDVSHMGQAEIRGADAARLLETLVPGEIQGLGVGKTRYTVFTNDQGGILDDLMVSKLADDHLFLVINAACKHQDFAHLKAHLGGKVELRMIEDRSLVALQGPGAAAAMATLSPEAGAMTFMTIREISVAGIKCLATRSGYTGEDGWELSVADAEAETLVRALLAAPGVKPAGLGARDSLRLEAGLCLYGSDIDTTTTPVEGNIAWIMNKRRKAEGGFPGAAVIQAQLAEGPPR
ncbi:MAG: glycine cleavage system aminomethyltransferase GcvT, partial [Magnetospirillum sp.]|nr:glycine cleavage system aminomethyltransferase GcvT [Magnetospirillum sp.]